MTILLIILLILLLFRGGGKPKVVVTSKSLASYAATSAEVRFTIDGPVTADAKHEQIRVTVDKDNVTFEHIQGYEGNVVKLQQYANNTNAYTTFLLALGRAGYTSGASTPALHDERGYCPLGDRYIIELLQDDRTLERYWATNCGKPKTYLGNLQLTKTLFQAQVPDYNTLVGGIVL